MESVAAILERRIPSLRNNAVSRMSVKSIRGKYDLTPEELEENLLDILRIEKEQDKCRGCTGETCWRDEESRGIIPVVRTEGGHFSEVVRLCKYERQRREQAKIARLLASSGVPRLYAESTLEDYRETEHNRKAIEAARWVLGGEDSVYIYGETGTGKTMLASIIANEAARRGRSVIFSSVPDLMADIRASFGSRQTAEIVEQVKDAQLLILDDLGAERATQWVGEQLFAIINARYSERRQTVITSNYAPDKLADHLGERIVSRIYGMCARVMIGGKDWRMAS